MKVEEAKNYEKPPINEAPLTFLNFSFEAKSGSWDRKINCGTSPLSQEHNIF